MQMGGNTIRFWKDGRAKSNKCTNPNNKEDVLTSYVDVNLYQNLVTRRLVSGILHLVKNIVCLV